MSSPHAGAEDLGASARQRLAGFAHVLRANGFKVGIAETRDALAILGSPAAARPSSLEAALRALFCATHSDWKKFDEIFEAFWRRHRMRRVQTLRGASAESRAPLRRIADAGPSQDSSGLPDHVERRGADGEMAGGRGRREGASTAENIAATDLRELLTVEDIPAGTQLFHKGDTGDAMYLIESGRIRISIHDQDA